MDSSKDKTHKYYCLCCKESTMALFGTIVNGREKEIGSSLSKGVFIPSSFGGFLFF